MIKLKSLILGIFKSDLIKEGLDDKWTDGNHTVTLQQLLDFTKNVPIVNLPPSKLQTKVLNWDNNPDEIEKIEKSKLDYPVLVFVNDDNSIKYIVDGNHRIQKSLRNKLPMVKCKLIQFSKLPSQWKQIFE